MGIEIDRDEFDDTEFEVFQRRLEDCLEALRRLLEQPGFGVGPATVGAELELALVDAVGEPLPENQAVLAETGDERVTLEIDRFNLELNPDYTHLAGRPFRALGEEMRSALAAVRRAAAARGGRVAMIGILPTLRAEHLQRSAITDSARYRAIDKGLARLRGPSFQVCILDPAERMPPVVLERHDVALEGANTSFQVHLRTDPDQFAATYNAAQMATAPVLAVAGNSPLFLGRELWEETRVALFEQSADDRDASERGQRLARVAVGTGWSSDGVLELFEEAVRLHEPLLPLCDDPDPLAELAAGRTPALQELRLHQSTVWRWNRPVFDPADGGHVRVEMRALPAGPTVRDMLANGAFLVGLTLALARHAPAWTRALPFVQARANFYRAARRGLDAELAWPLGPGDEVTIHTAADLARLLLPQAQQALTRAGVDPKEAEELLAVIRDRIDARQTGAVWQRRTLSALTPTLGRDRALPAMLERYLEHSAADTPVHTWPVPDASS